MNTPRGVTSIAVNIRLGVLMQNEQKEASPAEQLFERETKEEGNDSQSVIDSQPPLPSNETNSFLRYPSRSSFSLEFEKTLNQRSQVSHGRRV